MSYDRFRTNSHVLQVDVEVFKNTLAKRLVDGSFDDDPVRIVLSITATDLSEVQRHGS